LDEAREELPLAWGHFIEGVASMMDDDNDSWAKLGEAIPLA